MARHEKDDPTDSPTAWFAVLEAARSRGDFEVAADAVRNLRRLGVTVRFTSAATNRRPARKS